jgi:hypothetical protein
VWLHAWLSALNCWAKGMRATLAYLSRSEGCLWVTADASLVTPLPFPFDSRLCSSLAAGAVPELAALTKTIKLSPRRMEDWEKF